MTSGTTSGTTSGATSGTASGTGGPTTAGVFSIEIDPMMDDQEQDARLTSGTIYWEGAVTAKAAGMRIGRGYLELTGYAGNFACERTGTGYYPSG